MKKYLAFDIGGTDIKYGIIDDNYNIISSNKIPTHAHEGGDKILERIINVINDYKNQEKLTGVAISTAGVVNPYTGEIVGASDTIPNYLGLKIKETVKERTNLNCEVLNDVKCFALCEHQLGNAKNTENFVMITIGTGIGGAIFINNQLIYGKEFGAGEIGYMNINNHKYEKIASITALINFANKYIRKDNWTGKKIFDLYDNNDSKAKQIVDMFYTNLATGIANLMYVFNPDKIIIGGGITGRKEKFRQELISYINKIVNPFFNKTEILLAKFSNQSGLLGALIHYKNMQNL